VGTLTCEDAFGLSAHVGGFSLGLDACNQVRERTNAQKSQATFRFCTDPDLLSEVLAQPVSSKGALLLDPLSKLTVEEAGILAAHAGTLSLKSLSGASDAVFEALLKYKSHSSLRSPKFISDGGAAALAAHKGGLSLWCGFGDPPSRLGRLSEIFRLLSLKDVGNMSLLQTKELAL
jgi:hypothetical protein